MTSPHDELLEAAVAAQWRYEMLVAKARAERTEAFKAAYRGPVSASEIARQTGLSNRQVGRIVRGEA